MKNYQKMSVAQDARVELHDSLALTGAGDKAFCAGGCRSIYQSSSGRCRSPFCSFT